MTACSQVLESPELLTYIFEQVAAIYYDDVPCPVLVDAACVNSIWFETATDVLWGVNSSHWPPTPWTGTWSVSALSELHRARRQKYANKVKRLHFGRQHDWLSHTLFAGLHFPRLRALNVYGGDARFRDWDCPLDQYIQPSLKSLEIHCWSEKCSKEFLDVATRNCRLESITLEPLGKHISPPDFVQFLSQNTKTLQELQLDIDPSTHVFNDDLVLQLSRMCELLILHISGHCEITDLCKQVERLDYKPFASLIDLSLKMNSKNVPVVLSLTPNIKKFTLEVSDRNI